MVKCVNMARNERRVGRYGRCKCATGDSDFLDSGDDFVLHRCKVHLAEGGMVGKYHYNARSTSESLCVR